MFGCGVETSANFGSSAGSLRGPSRVRDLITNRPIIGLGVHGWRFLALHRVTVSSNEFLPLSANEPPGASSPFPISSTADSPTGVTPRDWNNAKAPHLPFRRISLTPSLASPFPSSSSHRASVASALSFNSLPEGDVIEAKTPQSDAFASSLRAASKLSDHNAPRRRPSSSGSLSSIELTSKMRVARHSRPPHSQRSRSRIGGGGPLEELHNEKRLKVMNELWETEKAYVEGLDLIYAVCHLISSIPSP